MPVEIKSIDGRILRTVKADSLRGADLRGADLRGANLYEANLYEANLRGANLYEADLRGANLYEADLRGADLRGADLRGADLRGANLRGANLRGAKNIPALVTAQSNICAEGELIVYKKLCEGVAVLRIPADAKRSNATGRKCRAEYAVVVSLPKGVKTGTSRHDLRFTYHVGETVRPREPFCEDRWNECASGIHFFLTREEAKAY